VARLPAAKQVEIRPIEDQEFWHFRGSTRELKSAP
jgi:hypothetical protein